MTMTGSRQGKSFKSIKESESKANFAALLVKTASGKLTVPEIQAILGGLSAIHPNYEDWSVTLHADPRHFAKVAMLREIGMNHSWAGERKTVDEGHWPVGGGSFGSHLDMTFSDNGNLSDPDVRIEDPDFVVGRTQVVAIATTHSDSYGRPSTSYEEEWNVHILLTGAVMEVDPRMAQILEILA